MWDSGRVRLSHNLEVYSFDLAGRPIAITRRDEILRRGLNGEVLRIQRYHLGQEKFHACQVVNGEEKRALLKATRDKVEGLRHLLGREFRHLVPVLKIDLEKDAKRFSELYGRVGILPPDCYRSLLLNLTQGCSYNKCSFCHFFKKQDYKLRSPEEFREHIHQVKESFAHSIKDRRGIFLGQANAANVPLPNLLEALRAIREAFPCELTDRRGELRHQMGFDRVASFMDTFSQVGRGLEDWRLLRKSGLKAVYLGVESGCIDILRLLRKPGHPRQIRSLVDTLKAAHLAVNVILMAGVGGKQLWEEHVRDTVALLNGMPLTGGDRIYLSAFVPAQDSDYARLAGPRGLTPMNILECRYQTKEIRRRLQFPPPPKGPAVTLYDIHQFTY